MNFKVDHFSIWQRIFYRLVRPVLTDSAYANMSLQRWLNGGNIGCPQTFNEKLQWLKVYNRNPQFCIFADKLSVREYVKEKLGNNYLNELLGVYSSVSDINWSKLPKSFVLKATHGSGMNIFVNEKDSFDKTAAIAKLRYWLKADYSLMGREWIYKNVPRRIIAEQFLRDAEGCIPKDYKVFCFEGEPYCIQVDINRFSDHRRAYFDSDWKRLPFTILYPHYDGEVNKPKYLAAMLEAAKRLSENIPFVRVDFYSLPELIFGEMTFYPGNGTEPFDPPEWDQHLGDKLILF
ncbi:ATP-grasp fold amidoligase family protein [Leptolyngbya sp. KIOST-1]|uniref:ATP-grasp fold amidoligase family protein n=1 Tax=Leptolyngbya sp. KIOST-1 TaxID=1229172 RepID=UPI0009079308|nr:ATP-grasp fold amidoligase family protein [Leptolyngbya sp. KIOST-1]